MKQYVVRLPLLLALAVSADAHAVLVKSSPAPNSAVSGQVFKIALTFNSRIDRARSRLTLVGPDSSERRLTVDVHSPPDTLAAQADGLKTGSYRLRWQVLAVDGHITSGEIPFRVEHPTA